MLRGQSVYKSSFNSKHPLHLSERDLVSSDNSKLLVHLLAASNNRKLARLLNNNVTIATTDPLSTLDARRVALVKCSEDVGEKNLADLKFCLQGTTGRWHAA